MYECGYFSHGLYIAPDYSDAVLPCCEFSRNEPSTVTYLAENPWTEKSKVDLLNGEYLRSLRRTAIQGKSPDICRTCVKKELITGTSPRHRTMFSSRQVKEWIDPTDVEYIQVKLSNICNFKCVMCNMTSSHLIAKEMNNKQVVREVEQQKIDQLKELLPKMKNLRTIIFVGGEPLFNTGTLEELLNYIPKSAELCFHTNGSFYNEEMLDKMYEFKEVRMLLSIDGTHEYFNYQRTGGNWNEVVENIRKTQKNYPRMFFEVHATFTCLTAPDLPRFFEEMDKFNFSSVQTHFVDHPKHYQLNLLKQEVCEDLITKLSNNKKIVSYLKDAIKNPATKEQIDYFWTYTEYLDRKRIKLDDHIPEVREMIRTNG